MIPDKVYLDIIDEDCGYMIAPSFENNGGTEYIRKDALLEWLEEMKFYSDDNRKIAYQNVIDKLHKL